VLVVIDAVVGLFVGLQIAYLFGGQSTIVAAGMTYSDYARRGFFELVAAACLAVRWPSSWRRPSRAEAGRISWRYSASSR
jgi:hypothetical protein